MNPSHLKYEGWQWWILNRPFVDVLNASRTLIVGALPRGRVYCHLCNTIYDFGASHQCKVER